MRTKTVARDLRHTLSLILAGGVGSRLNVLVRERAKPAVPFGGIYRIIDFALSSVMNSGLERVGILTQYLPYSLTEHIANGQPWGLVGRTREVKILPPHQGTHGSDWYQGTADAVYRNLRYIERHDPELVVILSGDHVYSMDYAALIQHHVEMGADATLAVRTVPWEEASNFGTVHVDAGNWITGFEEKPANPKSNLISMGIYVFSCKVLMQRLRDITGMGAGPDFGHHIFPTMLQDGAKLAAMAWDGYWQDVGTIRAYFDCHMDLINPTNPLNLRSWGLRTNLEEADRSGDRAAGWVGPRGSIRRSLMGRGCRVDGTVEGSVLSPGVVIEEGAVVRNSILMHDSVVEAGAELDHVVADKRVRVGRSAQVGLGTDTRVNQRFPSHLDSGITLLGKGSRIGPNASVGKNVVIFQNIDLGARQLDRVESGDTIDV